MKWLLILLNVIVFLLILFVLFIDGSQEIDKKRNGDKPNKVSKLFQLLEREELFKDRHENQLILFKEQTELEVEGWVDWYSRCKDDNRDIGIYFITSTDSSQSKSNSDGFRYYILNSTSYFDVQVYASGESFFFFERNGKKKHYNFMLNPVTACEEVRNLWE